jgi:hypothetical protein
MLATDSGFTKHVLESEVKINDKVLLVGLQAHNLNEGVISAMSADRGGQWLLYQPNI